VDVNAFVDIFADPFLGLGSTEGFVVGLVKNLGDFRGFKGPEYYAVWSSKWILDFLKRIDLRSVGSAMIIKLDNLNFMNSWDLWALRNAKALKCSIVATEGLL